MLSTIAKAFRQTKSDALSTWRASVTAIARGKSIDLAALRAAAGELGIPTPAIAGEFDRDVQALAAHEEAVSEEKVVARQLPSVSKAAAAARERIPQLQAELEQLIDAASSELPMASELASRKRRRQEIEAANPRLFAASIEPAVEPEAPATLDSIPVGEAAFVN